MRLSAPLRHEELEVLRLPFNGHLPNLSDCPHYAHVIQFLRHVRLSKDDFGPLLELLVLTRLTQKIYR